MLKDEKAYIVVETIGAFLLFVLLIASILGLVGVVSLQARVHHAITETAQTLSMYSYILEITGQTNRQTVLSQADPNKVKTGMGVIAEVVNSFTPDSQGSQGSTALDAASDLFSDPASLVSLFMSDANNPAFSEFVIRPLIGRYLRNGTMSGDQYLKYMGIEGGIDDLQILGYDYGRSGSNGRLIDRDEGITITVRYDVSYSFGGLPLPFTKLSITQSAATRAWLGGEGARYTG